MKTQRNIFIAFLLNLSFSVFELVGGIWTGSVAIASDALHDIGDAASIGIAWLLERKSKRPPDQHYTYGYTRFSVLGGLITGCILLLGSCLVLYHAAVRLVNPAPIHYDGMIVFAVIGAGVNLAAAFFTRGSDSLNQRAVNLHMLEDVLGWLVVLVGAVVMRFTQLVWLDPLLSIAVAVFILINAIGNLRQVADLFLEKVPDGISLPELTEHLCAIDGVLEVHHIHIWSLDGQHSCATMHIRTGADSHTVKEQVRRELAEHGIYHATLELEAPDEPCHGICCTPPAPEEEHHHHHHHHHH